MNIIKRLLTQMSLTRALDKPFNEVGEMLENMDSEARETIQEVAVCTERD